MPTRPVHFSGMPAAIKSAPMLGEDTEEVQINWLDLDAAVMAELRGDGIV
jgi:crotonobetainyl-CoA:carnitine CoA-transferase CaiB-like acyl-CoA transferase